MKQIRKEQQEKARVTALPKSGGPSAKRRSRERDTKEKRKKRDYKRSKIRCR